MWRQENEPRKPKIANSPRIVSWYVSYKVHQSTSKQWFYVAHVPGWHSKPLTSPPRHWPQNGLRQTEFDRIGEQDFIHLGEMLTCRGRDMWVPQRTSSYCSSSSLFKLARFVHVHLVNKSQLFLQVCHEACEHMLTAKKALMSAQFFGTLPKISLRILQNLGSFMKFPLISCEGVLK